MAGSGKPNISQETQRILTHNGIFRLVQTAGPIHKACKHVNGITLHRLLDVSPSDYSYGYSKVLGFTNHAIIYIYIFIDEINMVPEQVWNVIAHIKQQFGFIFWAWRL